MIAADGSETLRKPQAPATHRGIPRTEEIVGFAPLPRYAGSAQCRSRAGRLRDRHEADADGARCIFCDADLAA